MKPSYGLTDEQITQMLAASRDHAADDMQARALREQQVEGRRILDAVEAALDEDGHALLSAEERAAIEARMNALRATLAGSDHRAIKAAIDDFNHATESYAARRMDASIKKALTGQKLADVST